MSKGQKKETLGQKRKPKPKPEETVYDWQLEPQGVLRFASNTKRCFVEELVSGKLSDFHDKQLEEATNKINLVLRKTRESKRDKTKCLSILKTKQGLSLAWTKKAVSPFSSEKEICEALGI